MNHAKLKGKLAEKNYSQTKLAKEMGITLAALNAKINNRSSFTLQEAVEITDILGIDNPIEIFFDKESHKCNDANHKVN